MSFRLFVTCLMAAVLSGCFFSQPKMVVENRCGVDVDSVVLFAFAQRLAAIGPIPANEVLETRIPKGSLSSGHDLAIGAYGMIGKDTIRIGTWFTDLGASYDEARIVIEPDNRGRIVLQ